MKQQRKRRALIVGGSLGGASAAIALRAVGWDTMIFERSPVPLKDRGAGLRVAPIMMRLLREKGQVELHNCITAAKLIRFYGPRGVVKSEVPVHQHTTSWEAFHRRLMAEIPADLYRLDSEVTEVHLGIDGAGLRFASGDTVEGDLVVFADGTYSTGRQLLATGSQAVYAGYVCFRGLVHEQAVPRTTREVLDGVIHLVYPEPGQFGAYQIPGPDASIEPGNRYYNWIWYWPAAEGAEFDALMTDVDGNRRFSSVLPGKVRQNYVDMIRADAEILPPLMRDLVRATEQPFIQTIVDAETPRMSFGRSCLIGDAAFGGRPHLAAGTAKAVVNATTLAQALVSHDGIDAALKSWEPRQRELGLSFLEENRRIGQRYLFSDEPVVVGRDTTPRWRGED